MNYPKVMSTIFSKLRKDPVNLGARCTPFILTSVFIVPGPKLMLVFLQTCAPILSTDHSLASSTGIQVSSCHSCFEREHQLHQAGLKFSLPIMYARNAKSPDKKEIGRITSLFADSEIKSLLTRSIESVWHPFQTPTRRSQLR